MRSISQADLARRIGVSQPAVANWESGIHDPRRLMLARLADVLQTPLDWLAAGNRSAMERDKHAGAAYIRRAVRHVPVLPESAVAILANDHTADPHEMAEDYIPVTTNAEHLVALFISDPAVDLAFTDSTLVVVEYADRAPIVGSFCLAMIDGVPRVRRWQSDPPALLPHSSADSFETIDYSADATPIVGCVRFSIKIF